jgi:hypothetical protein
MAEWIDAMIFRWTRLIPRGSEKQLNPAVFGCGEDTIVAFDVVFRQRDTEELHRSIYVTA